MVKSKLNLTINFVDGTKTRNFWTMLTHFRVPVGQILVGDLFNEKEEKNKSLATK